MTPVEPSAHRVARGNYPLIAWTCLGFAALVIGGLIMVTSQEPASFGWFAYAPLSGDTFEPVLPFFTLQEKIGMATAAFGLAVLVFCGGWAFGRSRSF